MPPVSLSEIARRADVSIATVSLALRDKGFISRATAGRVKRIAAELGYRPNPLLASLATRRFRSKQSVEGTPLAIFEFPVLPGLAESAVSRNYVKPMTAEAARLGYAPAIYRLRNDEPAAALQRELYHRMAQGIIVTGGMDFAVFGRAFDWSQFAVVACARYAGSLPFHTVRPNIFKSIKVVFGELRRRGYQRIGFALGRHEVPMEDDEARHGAAMALEASYLNRRDRLPVFSGPIDDAAGLVAWVRKQQPDAVVGFSVGQYWALRDAGFRIPRDLGFASLHLPETSDAALPSGLTQNPSEIARQCVILVDQLIRNRERGLPEHQLDILVPPVWHEGRTLRPAPSGAAKPRRASGGRKREA